MHPDADLRFPGGTLHWNHSRPSNKDHGGPAGLRDSESEVGDIRTG